MKPIVSFEDTLHDSPRFRSALEENEADIDLLESKLEKVVKLCSAMIEAGKAYMATKVNFINGIWDLANYFQEDKLNVSALNKLIQILQEIDKFQLILFEQAKKAVCKNLNDFIQTDIRKTKETKKCFERCSDDLDQALARTTQTSKSKPQECEDASNLVTASKSMFQHTALDYVSQISLLQAKKRHEILDSLLSYGHAYITFFHQGSDLCQDVDPFVKQLEKNLGNIRDETKQLEKAMDERHSLVGVNNTIRKSASGQLEGYLFKRTSNTFKTWKRRWFVIQNHQLVYCKRSRDGNEMTVMEEDLRLCTVKPVLEGDRRFCFEVLSPTKSHVLQAESEEMYNCWISALQSSIDAALHQTLHGSDDRADNAYNGNAEHSTRNGDNKNGKESPNNAKPITLWEELASVPGNEFCCDCSAPRPQWASINLGIILCIECSGIHRSLGVHYSKVRSLRLDDWDHELVKVMKELGNTFVNQIYEGKIDEKVAVKPTSDSSSNIREAWIKAKYVDKAFMTKVLPGSLTTARRAATLFDATSNSSTDLINEPESPTVVASDGGVEEQASNVSNDSYCTSSIEEQLLSNPNLLLYKATGDANFKQMFFALALGADVNWKNIEDEDKCPIFKAIQSGSIAACELLLLNAAKLDCRDANDRTPLHLASDLGYTGHVCLLLKRGANQTLKDKDDKDALHYAVNNANADIVTLLRLARLNEEMKESEFGNSDETFNEVVRDFSQRASNNPTPSKNLDGNS
ncbi:hypothetical protein CHUAL_014006 [Chamberlinius hualienensis]